MNIIWQSKEDGDKLKLYEMSKFQVEESFDQCFEKPRGVTFEC